MRVTIWKLRVLWRAFLAPAIEHWQKEVWRKDPDQNYCCDGRMCGCYGQSVRESYERHE